MSALSLWMYLSAAGGALVERLCTKVGLASFVLILVCVGLHTWLVYTWAKRHAIEKASCRPGDNLKYKQHSAAVSLVEDATYGLLDLLQAGALPTEKDLATFCELVLQAQHQDVCTNFLQALHSAQPDVEEYIKYGLGSLPQYQKESFTDNDMPDLDFPDNAGEIGQASIDDIIASMASKRSVFDPSGSRGSRGQQVPMRREASALSSKSPGGRRPPARSRTFCVSCAFKDKEQAGNTSLKSDAAASRPALFQSKLSHHQSIDPGPASEDWSNQLLKASNDMRRTLTRQSISMKTTSNSGTSSRQTSLDAEPSFLASFRRSKSRRKSMPFLSLMRTESGELNGLQVHGKDTKPQAATPPCVSFADPSFGRPAAALTDKVTNLLAQADNSFTIDAFALNEATEGHPLSVLGFFLLHKSGLMSTFKMQPTALARFLRKIEAGYHAEVPYHNAIHAANVLHIVHATCSMGGLGHLLNDPLYVLAAYLAAIIHDHDHQGANNAFHVTTGSALAMRYNDISPLEHHHLASSLGVMRDYDILPLMTKLEMTSLRKIIIDLVLSTDMAEHLKVMGRINALAAMIMSHRQQTCRVFTGHSRRMSITLSSRQSDSSEGAGHAPRLESRKSLDVNRASDANFCTHVCCSAPFELDDAKKTLLLQVTLKCADLGHVAEEFSVHLRWVQLLEKEFFQQGDMEKAIGLPVSPLFDRNHAGVSKSQDGFLSFVTIPLFEDLVSILPDAQPLLASVEANSKFWKEQELQQTAK